jgi:tol-pal system protein YbgF
MIVGILLIFSACVLDRTGQSASASYARELASQQVRVRELESSGEGVGRRVAQLEEVTRARGQEDILKMETVDDLRGEVAKMRGEFEVIDHDYRTFEMAALGTQSDVDSRLLYLEQRMGAVERSLGIRPPPRADAEQVAAAVTKPPSADSTTGTGSAPEPNGGEAPAPPLTTEEFFGLITENLEGGNAAAARAVAKRFLAEHPKDDRAGEAYYRIAESFQNEGDYKLAAGAFQDVLDKAPTSTWAPWSLLRQGECFEGLGRAGDAKIFYCDVMKKYPKSKAAKDAKSKCSG